MKVAVSSSGKDLDSQIDPRFGRCSYFIILDLDDMSFEAFENGSAMLGGGAGIQSSQFVASKGAEAVITGNCGPNAVKVLDAAGIKIFLGQSGTVKEAIERLKNNNLDAAREANVPDHFGMQGGDTSSRQGFEGTASDRGSFTGMGMGGGRGMGRGMGMGGGRGMGRGMGMGGGRGMGQGTDIAGGNDPGDTSGKKSSKDQELDLLKRESEELSRQMEEVRARIKKLETDN
jgi:predicted Fe-Mo cluster-binding NifX family protein